MMGVLNHLSTLLLLSLLPPSLSHVVGKFSDVPECSDFFLDRTTPNLPDILVGGTVKDQNRYKPICQKYKNSYRFATLYDTINKIPVFSAYTFTGAPTGRPNPPWMIEPQLNNINNSPKMSEDKGQSPDHQAGNNDYKDSIKEKGVNRGHLFPCSHANDLETQKSTFTLTNIVPQVVSFNGGSWEDMEQNVIKTLQKDCLDNNGKIKAYVVTGAVPSESNTLKNRVNIPDLLWTAYCCYNSNQRQWVAEAHWGENINEKKGKTLKTESLGALENKLNKGVKVFPDQCPRGLNPNTAPSWFGSIVSTLRNLKNSVMNRIG
ncbi:endonuclease domain-containing 1 protein-like [Coregonus clupeaformis]|uniref:endonuclease domain-containing 1 protein-like n=1 Tax=Coregonus clupeaformis TaxID=59861 RepID=UPI001E1C63B3|nr:endonuclease domain-containing 1 protein-like [Coregonus clupeaformis]